MIPSSIVFVCVERANIDTFVRAWTVNMVPSAARVGVNRVVGKILGAPLAPLSFVIGEEVG